MGCRYVNFFGSFSRRGSSKFIKRFFFPKFFFKDLILIIVLFFSFIMFFPLFLIEEENFLLVDLISSPIHIKPEWYFLFLYRMLRRVPSKLVGILIIGAAVIFYLLQSSSLTIVMYKHKNMYIFFFVFVFLLLRILGGVAISFLSRIVGLIFIFLGF